MPIISINDLEQTVSPATGGNIISISDLEKQSKPPLQFKTNEEARKAQIIARHKQGLAEIGTQGPMPYINALGESVVKTGEQILKSPVSVPSQALTDIGQSTPLPKAIKNIANVLTGKKESDYKSFLKSTGASEEQSNIVGNIADIGLYPGGAGAAVGLAKAGAGAIKAGFQATAGGAKKAFKYVTDAFTGETKARIAAGEQKFALRQDTAQQAKAIEDVTKSRVNKIESNQDLVNKGYDALAEKKKIELAQYADKQGLDIQQNLPKVFGKQSEEYAANQKSIIDSLQDGQRQISVGKVTNDMENVLLKYRILRKDPYKGLVKTDVPLTPAENKVLGLYDDLKKGGDIPVEDLISHKQFIRPSAPKFGQQWGSDEKLQSDISNIFANHVPDALKALDKKYAPFLEWKGEAIGQLKVFNNKYSVETGAISRQASSNVEASEQRLMQELEKHYRSQFSKKIQNLNKDINRIPDMKDRVQFATTETIKKMRSDAADAIWKLKQAKSVKLNDIDNAVNKLAHQYKTRQFKIGGIGLLATGGANAINATIKYFLHREIYSGMKGN